MKTLLFFAILLFGNISLRASQDTLFPVPDNLRDNVTFWKIIYTRISLTEGVLHDRDYPLIIYDTIETGSLYGKQLDNYTDKAKRKIVISLQKICSGESSNWGPQEKKIAALFRNYPPHILKGAEQRIRFQLGQRERFLAGLKRSGAYIDTIRLIFASHGIPLQLAFLPHVESSFDYQAYSRAGAAGIWQFMPSTGKEYLKINDLFDERRDPVLSTVAAARLLSKNYSKLKSWPLAITAYNHGLTGVMNAVKKTGSRDLGEIARKHESATFRFASKNFYSCFIAASEIASEPEKYFGTLQYARRESLSVLTLSISLDTKEISSILGITEKDFSTVNLFISPNAFKKRLRIPAGTKIFIAKNISKESIERNIAMYLSKNPLFQKRLSGTHSSPVVVVSNDKNSQSVRKETESKTKTNNVPSPTSGTLASSSDFISQSSSGDAGISKPKNPSATIPSSKALSKADSAAIPTKPPEASAQTVKSDQGKKSFDKNIYDLKVTFTKKKNLAKITVLSNETVGHYAQWLNIPVHRILQINKIKKARDIHAGQQIVIQISEKSVNEFTAHRVSFHKSHEEAFFSKFRITKIRTRILEKGENLWSVCAQNASIPLWLLKKLNQGINFERLHPGTKIHLPEIIPVS